MCVFALIWLWSHILWYQSFVIWSISSIATISLSLTRFRWFARLFAHSLGPCCNHLALMRLNYYQNCTIHTQPPNVDIAHTHTERLINEHLNAHLTSRNSLYSPACPWHCGGSTWVNGYASFVFIRYSLYDNISIYFATRITFISPYAQRCTGSISTE